ncbi:MAG: 2Fe-2S iron-sulfur cluster-binding protein [Chlamydiota bacterium]
MATLFFEDTEEEVPLEDGSSLTEACEEAGVPFACTEGVCGTCVIEVKAGMENLSPFTEAERDFLGEPDKDNQERLACQCSILKETVRVTF